VRAYFAGFNARRRGFQESALIAASEAMLTNNTDAVFDLQKLIVSAIFGFALGVTGNIITFFLLNRDRHIRELERQSKKIAFWKTYHEMREKLPADIALPALQNEMIERQFREDMQNVFNAALGWDRRARNFAFLLAGFASAMVVGIAIPFLLSVIFPLDAGAPRGSAESIALSWLAQAVFLGIVWKVIFTPIRNGTQRAYLDIVRKNSGDFSTWLLAKHIFQSAFQSLRGD